MLHGLLGGGLHDLVVGDRRSSRLMPGLRGKPAVITTMSELAVSS